MSRKRERKREREREIKKMPLMFLPAAKGSARTQPIKGHFLTKYVLRKEALKIYD